MEADSWISLGRKISQRGSKDSESPCAEFRNERERGDKLQTVTRIYRMCWRIHENCDKWCSPLEDLKSPIQHLLNLILCLMGRQCK